MFFIIIFLRFLNKHTAVLSFRAFTVLFVNFKWKG